MMSKSALVWAVLLSLIPTLAFAGCTPGQDINSCAKVAYSTQTLLSATANVSYIDTTGTPTQALPTAPTSVRVETSMAPITAGPAITFVAPNPGSRVYFVVGRSFHLGLSLAGQSVKLAGRIRAMSGAYYLDDGSALLAVNPATGRLVATPVRVLVRSDLLAGPMADGSFVTITGVCRKEPSGELSMLPLSDAALVRLQ
jgi:hypothetical protein